MMYYAGRRIPTPSIGTARSRVHTFPAPVRGWVTNENLANTRPGAARVHENIFPTTRGWRLRGGSTKVATVGSAAVTRLIPYQSGSVEKLFAATASDIFDITSFNPDSAPTAAVALQTGGKYSWQQIGTVGGDFLVVVNGADSAQLYDGSTWQAITGVSTPAITGVTTSNLSHVWLYRNRLFFVEKNSLKAWFLPVDSVGGAAQDVSLAGVMQRGGSLLFGATWSLDAGDGIDDTCVFVSDQGEVAVYEGGNPTSATDWRLIGVYDITPPLGALGTMQAGGDLLIATIDGLVPLSQALQKDPAALSLSAVSRPIETNWRDEARNFLSTSASWQILKWPRENMAIVSLPHTAASSPTCYVVNLQTGAWAPYIGWDVQCLGLFSEDAFFGDSSGNIFKAESGGSDNGAPYVARYCASFDAMSSVASEKTAHMARATFRAAVEFEARLSLGSDYSETFPDPPDAVGDQPAAALWDAGVWDVSQWDDGGSGAAPSTVSTRWRSIKGRGFALAPQIQITVGNNRRPDAELVSFDLVYEVGGIVV